MQEPVWEACKENVLPTKRGRSAKGLSNILQPDQAFKKDLQQSERNFTTRIEEAKAIGNNQALLEAYAERLKWTHESFPSSDKEAIKLLEVIQYLFCSARQFSFFFSPSQGMHLCISRPNRLQE